MTMDNLNLFSYKDIAEHREKRKHCWEGCFTVDHEERNVIDFEAVGEISHTRSAFVCVCNYDDFMPPVNQFLF